MQLAVKHQCLFATLEECSEKNGDSQVENEKNEICGKGVSIKSNGACMRID